MMRSKRREELSQLVVFAMSKRERNTEADRLSMEGLQLNPRRWIIEEVLNGITSVSDHVSFYQVIDTLPCLV